MKKHLFFVLALSAGIGSGYSQDSFALDTLAQEAVAKHQKHVQVTGNGMVTAVLPDDEKDGRHQKFTLQLANGKSILVMYNLELLPRLYGLKVGDRIQFAGEYTWNKEGGVLSWTYKDPKGKHAPGWIQYDGKHYE